DPRVRFPVMELSDAEGLARDTSWSPGADDHPPTLLPGAARAGGAVREVLDGVLLGQQVGEDEIVTLFGARGRELAAVAEAADDVAPGITGDGLTALEVTEGGKRLDERLEGCLRRLMAAGLTTLPGTAAEILDDEVRAVLCPDKVNTEEWLHAHRTAHSVGLRSNITIMFGSVEQPVHWARHMVRTRALQKETGGFTEFVPLPFVHMGAPI